VRRPPSLARPTPREAPCGSPSRPECGLGSPHRAGAWTTSLGALERRIDGPGSDRSTSEPVCLGRSPSCPGSQRRCLNQRPRRLRPRSRPRTMNEPPSGLAPLQESGRTAAGGAGWRSQRRMRAQVAMPAAGRATALVGVPSSNFKGRPLPPDGDAGPSAWAAYRWRRTLRPDRDGPLSAPGLDAPATRAGPRTPCAVVADDPADAVAAEQRVGSAPSWIDIRRAWNRGAFHVKLVGRHAHLIFHLG
jgi:hypothetical protein